MEEKDYTREAQMACEAYVKAHPFHGPTYSLDDASFSLDEAANLIAQSRIERQHILRRIAAQEQSEEALDQQRENVSVLPDREAEKIQREWIEQGKLQGEAYANARNNRHSQPRLTQGVDPDLFRSTLSWIKRAKLRGDLGGRKALDNN